MSTPILAAYDPQSKDAGPARFALAAAAFTGAPVLMVSVCAPPAGGTYPVPPEPDLRPEAETAPPRPGRPGKDGAGATHVATAPVA